MGKLPAMITDAPRKKHPGELAQTQPAFIGVDPGASGGLVALSLDGTYSRLTAMPETPMDLLHWCRSHGLPSRSYAVLEENTGYVGGEGNPGSSMFKFGRNAGWCEMALLAAGIRVDRVTPGVWQKAVGVGGKKRDETKSQFKARLKRRAQELFPSLLDDITLSTADALLMAEYCRMSYVQINETPKDQRSLF